MYLSVFKLSLQTNVKMIACPGKMLTGMNRKEKFGIRFGSHDPFFGSSYCSDIVSAHRNVHSPD